MGQIWMNEIQIPMRSPIKVPPALNIIIIAVKNRLHQIENDQYAKPCGDQFTANLTTRKFKSNIA